MDQRTSPFLRAFLFTRGIVLVAILLSAVQPLWSQQSAPIRHVQVKWDAIAGAIRYELLVRPLGGDVKISESTTDTSLTVALAPGTYQVRVISYNIFDKPASASEWRYLDVVRVFRPVVTRVEPKILYSGVASTAVVLDGKYFLSETNAALVRNGAVVVRASVVESTDKRLSLQLDTSSVSPGSYELRVTNPEGLVRDVPDAVTVRPRIQPTLVSVALHSGYNDRVYRSRRVTGSGFEAGTRFSLTNGAKTIVLRDAYVESGTSALIDFDLGGATPGIYDLVAVNPGGLKGILKNAVIAFAIAAPVFESVHPAQITIGKSDGFFTIRARRMIPETQVFLRSHGTLIPTIGVVEPPAPSATGEEAGSEACTVRIDPQTLAPGTYDLVLKNSELLSTVAERAVTVLPRPVPSLDASSVDHSFETAVYKNINLRGKNLEPSFRVAIRKGSSQQFLTTRYVSPTELSFDADFRTIIPGAYDLLVVDSGHVVASLPGGIKIVNPPQRFVHPSQIRVTVGYPLALLMSQSFSAAVQSSFTGANVAAAFPVAVWFLPKVPVLRDTGIELEANYSRYTNPQAAGSASLDQIGVVTDLYYRTPFRFPLNAIVSVGYGGVVSLFHPSSSSQLPGGSSEDFFFKAGVSLEVDLGRFFTCELGGAWSRVSYSTAPFDSIVLIARAGFRLGK